MDKSCLHKIGSDQFDQNCRMPVCAWFEYEYACLPILSFKAQIKTIIITITIINNNSYFYCILIVIVIITVLYYY